MAGISCLCYFFKKAGSLEGSTLTMTNLKGHIVVSCSYEAAFLLSYFVKAKNGEGKRLHLIRFLQVDPITFP